MIKSLYLDTSVFGGYYDEEFSDNTIPFFERIIDERIQIYISELLISELAGAPIEVKELLNNLPEELKTEIFLTEETRLLADRYIAENVVGKTSRADCQHIAMATLAKVRCAC